MRTYFCDPALLVSAFLIPAKLQFRTPLPAFQQRTVSSRAPYTHNWSIHQPWPYFALVSEWSDAVGNNVWAISWPSASQSFWPQTELILLLTCIPCLKLCFQFTPIPIGWNPSRRPKSLFQAPYPMKDQYSNGLEVEFPTSDLKNTYDHTNDVAVVCPVLMSHPAWLTSNIDSSVFSLWEVKMKESSSSWCEGSGLLFHASRGISSNGNRARRLSCWFWAHWMQV